MANKKDCIQHIVDVTGWTRKQVSDLFDYTDNAYQALPLEERANQVGTIMSTLAAKGIETRALMDAVAEYHTVSDTVIRTNATQTINNALADKKTFREGMREFMKRTSDTVVAVQDKYISVFVNGLKRKELTKVWGELDTVKEAVSLVFDPTLTKLDKPGVSTPMAEHLRFMQKMAARDLNNVGIPLKDSPRLLFNDTIISPSILRTVSKDDFVNFLKGLNVDKDPYFGMSDNEIYEAWGDRYDKMTGASPHKVPGAVMDFHASTKAKYRNYAQSGTIFDAISFKDADSFFKFAQAFAEKDGKGNIDLQGHIYRRLEEVARQRGLVMTLGSKPEKMLDTLMESFAEKMSDEDLSFFLNKARKREDGGPKAKEVVTKTLRAVRDFYTEAHPKAWLAELDGSARSPVNVSLAKFGAMMRGVTSMLRLGNAVFSQVTDIPVKGAVLADKLGISAIEAMDMVRVAAGAFNGEEKKAYLRQVVMNLDMARLVLDGNTSGLASHQSKKLTTALDWYFTATVTKPVDRLMKEDTGWIFARLIGEELSAARAAGNLDPSGPATSLLKQAGMTIEDFEKMSYAPLKELDGAKVVDMDALLVESPETYEKMLLAFRDLVELATPTPGVQQQAIMRKGFAPGTPVGEAMGTVMQLKSFPITTATKIVPHLYRTGGMPRILLVGVQSAFLWYMSDSVKQMLENKTPRPLTDPATLGMMITRSGLGAIYADLLIQDYGRHGLSLAEVIAGPAPAVANELVSFVPPTLKAIAGAATGKKIEGSITSKMAVTKLNRLLPDFAAIQGLMDRFILDAIMSSLVPSYLEDRQKRLEQSGQEQLFR